MGEKHQSKYLMLFQKLKYTEFKKSYWMSYPMLMYNLTFPVSYLKYGVPTSEFI